MKSLKSRILAGAMAGVLSLSLAIPAFAGETTISGKYVDNPIAVTVPTTGTAQINPYGLDVTITGTTSKISGNQIVTMPLAIVNNSEMTLSVSASVTGEAKGDFMFGAATTNLATTKTKTGVVYLQVKEATGLTDSDADADNKSVKAASLAPLVAAWGEFVKPADGSKDILLKAGVASTGTDLALLSAADKTSNSGHEKIGGVALFRLAGEVVTSPSEAWAETDGFTATVAFTFNPIKTYTITNADASNKTTISATQAPAGTVVTVANTTGGASAVTITVTKASGGTVTVTMNDDGVSGTFEMPAENVSVTSVVTA